jgi:hypothetical protein
MKTQVGSAFMLAFNAWYYSFSPPVANQIAAHSAERTIMQAALYPMVGIMSLSNAIFQATSAFPEAAVILAGIAASMMLGAFYLGLPIGLVRARVKKFRAMNLGRSLERVLAVATLASGTVLAAGEFSGNSVVLMLSSAALVLSMMLLSSTVVSNRIVKLTSRGTMG